MRTGNWKAVGVAMLLAFASLGLAACGSGSDTTSSTADRPAVSAATADRLAKISDRIASDLDSGNICHAAHAADDLRSAVEESDLPATLRPGVDDAAGRLVDQVNCPPPPAPPAPPPEEKKPKKDEHGNQDNHGHGGDDKSGSDDKSEPGHSKNGGLVPPGQAKLKGEQG